MSRRVFQLSCVLSMLFLLVITGKAGELAEFSEPVDAKNLDGKWMEPENLPFNRNPFTVSVTVREEYDDNINTARTNKVSAFKTYITPSLLFEYPSDNTVFSMRATFNATYFSNGRTEPWEYGGQLLTSLSHSFTDRFSIDFRNQFRVAQEPDALDGNLTVLREDGTYINNNTSLQFNAQWTPIFSTVTAWNLQWWDYEAQSLGEVNNRLDNRINHDFQWLVSPTVTFVVGGFYRNTTYLDQSNAPTVIGSNGQALIFPATDRDYQAIGGYVGADWQASPTIVTGLRVGAELFDPADATESVQPYATAYFDWQLGARSSLDANFSHQVSDTSIANQVAQLSTTFIVGFNYQWTPRFSTRAQLVFRNSDYSNATAVSGLGVGDFSEQTIAIGLSGSYEVNTWLSIIAGYSFTDLISEISVREYVRNRVWIGLTGTF